MNKHSYTLSCRKLLRWSGLQAGGAKGVISNHLATNELARICAIIEGSQEITPHSRLHVISEINPVWVGSIFLLGVDGFF